MTKEEFDQFAHQAYQYLNAQQDILMAEYGMGRYERWDYDQETGEFVFSDKGIPKLIADFQVVGSISTISNTWLWSWANPSILESVKKDIYLVKEFGEEHGLKELTEERWPADELDGWTMTNVSATLLNAKGAYRCPDEDGALFVIFTGVWRPLGVRQPKETTCPLTKPVECSRHGKRSATLVCCHIAESLHAGASVGFHWSQDDSSPWPDAWCSRCNEILFQCDANGEWTDRSLEHASLKVLCSSCYDEAASLNFGTLHWRKKFGWPEPSASGD